jgi:hypothetical protein
MQRRQREVELSAELPVQHARSLEPAHKIEDRTGKHRGSIAEIERHRCPAIRPPRAAGYGCDKSPQSPSTARRAIDRNNLEALLAQVTTQVFE